MELSCGESVIDGKKRRGALGLLMLAVAPAAAFMIATPAHAATQTWDPGLTTTGSDGVGTWDTTTADWASGGADGVYINDGTTTPAFGSGGTVGNVTLNAANLNASGINFNLGYTINTTGADTLTLTSPNVSVATGITAVINAPLAGTNGLSLTGNGTLTLGTASTALTGDISIGAGATLKMTGLNTNGSFASSTLAWASLGYAANTESVGPYSVFGPTNAGTGNITVANGGTLSFGTASNNVINFGMKTVFIAGTGIAGAGAVTNPNQAGNGREFTAFDFLTLTADATISGSRMDIGRVGDPANTIPDKLDLGGHTLTINMNGSAQPMFGIQAAGNAKGNNVGTVVTSGQIDIVKGSLDIELNANLSNDGTSKITFEDNGAFANTGANLEVFKTDGVNCTRPMVFKGHNIIGPGAANAGAALASNMSITGPIGFESDVSGNPGNNTANCTLTLSGNIVENGTASISLLGSSTTVLTGTNTWTGGTNFEFSGTLSLGSAGAFPAGTPISFGNAAGLGGTFDLGGFNATVSAISATASGDTTSTIGNSSTTTPSTLTYAGGATPSTFAGVIKDSLTTTINVAGTATPRTGTQTMGVTVASGSLTLTGANTYSGGTTVTGGALVVGSLNALGTGPLAIHGGLVQLPASLGTVLLPSLTLDTSGAVDLTNNSLIVEATVSKASALSNIQSHAHTALTSSALAAHYGIAVIDNDNGSGGTRFSTFGGQSVDANSILIGAELLGDSNADGNVDLSDLSTVLNNFGATTYAWTSGNFDGAATIDLTDLSDVLNNFGASNGNAAAAVSAAPEPTSLAMLGLGVVALATRRRKA